MTASRRLTPLLLLLAGLAVLALAVALTVHGQGQEVTPDAAATGTNPPAKPTNLQASAAHDEVTLTWTASTDQTVTHYAILRRNPDTDPSQVFHVIESNAGPGTSYTDGSVSASSTYIYRAKSVSPTGVSQWSGYVKAETPAAPDPTPTSEPEPESTPVDLAPSNLTAGKVDSGINLSWSAPAEDSGSVTGYEILRAVGDGEAATLVSDTGDSATTYTDATATEAGESYAYRVKAIRGEERSQASAQAQVQVPHGAADLAPTGLSATLAGGGGMSLSWSAPEEDSGSVTGYEILRAVGEGDPATLVSDTGDSTTTYTDATATEAGESYAYQVKAIRGEDRSQASDEATVRVTARLTPATLESTVLGYSEEEGAGTLVPDEVTFDEDAAFRVTLVSAWPGVPGLVVYLSAGDPARDAALAGRDFVLEADEHVLVVGEAEFGFDGAVLSHSDTTGENGEYTGVVIATWLEGEPGLVAGETVPFLLERRQRPEEAQRTSHNEAATGRPRVLRSADGGDALFADTSGIADGNGLQYLQPDGTTDGDTLTGDGAYYHSFSYQWIRVDGGTAAETDIGDGSAIYHPVADDIGNRIKVQVSFEDEDGYSESLTSHPFGPIAEPAESLRIPRALVSNTGQSNSATASITGTYAMGFRLGDHGQGYGISSVSIELAAVPPDDLTVSLWTAGLPGFPHATARRYKLFDFGNPSSFQAGLNKFTAPPGAFAYQNINYYVVLSGSGSSLSINETTSDNEDAGGEPGAALFNDVGSRAGVLRLAVEGSKRDRGILAANYAQPPKTPTYNQEIISLGDNWSLRMVVGGADRYLIRGFSIYDDDTTSRGGGFTNPYDLRSGGLSGTTLFTLHNTRDTAGISVLTAPQGATVPGGATYDFVQRLDGDVRWDAILTRVFGPEKAGLDPPTGGATLTVTGDAELPSAPYMAVIGERLNALVSNLGQADNGDVSVGGTGAKVASQGFTTGPGEGDFELLGIGVNMASSALSPDGPTSVSVAVHADSGGKPGAKLFDLVSPDEFGAGHSYFEAPPGATLQVSTSYVLVWRHLGGTFHGLRRTTSDSEDSGALAGFSIANAFYLGADTGNLTQDSGGNALEIAVYGTLGSRPATGRPVIYPSAAGAGVLLADTLGIDDPNGSTFINTDGDGGVGLGFFDFSFQWFRVDSETGAETETGVDSHRYQPVEADTGHRIKVRVEFTDRDGNPETATSLPFGPIARAGPPAYSSTLVGNTGQSASATATITQQYAQGFRLGDHGQGYEISSVSIDLAAVPSGLSVSLWAGAPPAGSSTSSAYSTVAEYKVFDFINPPSFKAGLNRFTAPPGAFAYQNVRYWIVLSDFGGSLSVKETTSDDEDGGETGAVIHNNSLVRPLGSTARWDGTDIGAEPAYDVFEGTAGTSRASVLRLAIEGSRRTGGILASNYAQAPSDAQEIISIGDEGGMPIRLGAAERYLVRGFSWVADGTGVGPLMNNPFDLRSGWTLSGTGKITDAGTKWYTLTPDRRHGPGIAVYTAPQGATVPGNNNQYMVYDKVDTRPPLSVLARFHGTTSNDDDPPTAPGASLSDTIGDFVGRPLMAFLGEPLVSMVRNLGRTNNGYVVADGANKVLSQGFTAGSDQFGYRLQGIGVNIEGSSSSFPDDSTSVSVAVHADSGGKPGDKLFDLISPTEYGAGHSFFEAPPGTYLDPGTGYVLVWRYNSGTTHRLQKTSVDSEDAGARTGAGIANAFYRGADLGSLTEDSGGNALEIAVYTEVLQTAPGGLTLVLHLPAPGLVSNMGQTPDANTVLLLNTRKDAQSFTTGPGDAVNLDSVDVHVNSFSGSASDVSAAVYTVGSGDPDSKLYDLITPATLGTGAQKFRAPAGATLTANTTYSVVFSVTGSPTFGLGRTSLKAEDSGGAEGWSIADKRQRHSGGSWSAPSGVLRIRVNGYFTEVILPTEVEPGWALVPDELAEEGGAFRLLFMTSTKSAATSTDIATYNSFVQARAAAGHAAIQEHSDNFRAVASTEAVSAVANTATSGASVPIYWLGGNKLADN